MEQEFREYLKNCTTLVPATINIYVTALRLDGDIYENVRTGIDFPSFYEIEDIDTYLEQYEQVRNVIPNQHNTNGNGNDNGNLSAAFRKYKLFLQSLEVVKQMDLYDVNPDDFPINQNVHWYFEINNRNGRYPIKATVNDIFHKIDLSERHTTDQVKTNLRNIFGESYINFIDTNDPEEPMIDEKLQETIKLLKSKKQIILQGSPGTGKTRLAIELAYYLLYEQPLPNDKEGRADEIQEMNEESLTNGQYKLIQFHPAYSYEDFVRGIMASNDENGNISYETKNKVLAEMAENATKDPDSDFVLIIDEINRANLSAVLGELIYALEYRGQPVESMYAIDDNREIILPKNLYIIGTMNTADRSVGHIDYAIRRRFAFVDVKTDESVIPEAANTLFTKIKTLFEEKLSEEFDKDDVMIGHSYFLGDDLAQALEYEIKPILCEYVKDGVLTCTKDTIYALNVN